MPLEDEVSADAVLGRAPTGPVAPPSQPAGPPQPGGTQPGFSNLFGWRADKGGDNDDAPKPQMDGALVSTPDDHPEPAPFDDVDLEIPAFLRRSANH